MHFSNVEISSEVTADLSETVGAREAVSCPAGHKFPTGLATDK